MVQNLFCRKTTCVEQLESDIASTSSGVAAIPSTSANASGIPSSRAAEDILNLNARDSDVKSQYVPANKLMEKLEAYKQKVLKIYNY